MINQRFGNSHASKLFLETSKPGNIAKSGVMPVLSISTNLGVTYRPTVNTTPLPSLSSYTDCINPLPYVLEPTTVARQLSFNEPVKISLADADLEFTRTTSGSVTFCLLLTASLFSLSLNENDEISPTLFNLVGAASAPPAF